jgi:hypothetical protein
LVTYEAKDYPIWLYLGGARRDLARKKSGEEAGIEYLKAIEYFNTGIKRGTNHRELFLNYIADSFMYRLGIRRMPSKVLPNC